MSSRGDNSVDTLRTDSRILGDDNLVTGSSTYGLTSALNYYTSNKARGSSKLILSIAYRGIYIFRLTMRSRREPDGNMHFELIIGANANTRRAKFQHAAPTVREVNEL